MKTIIILLFNLFFAINIFAIDAPALTSPDNGSTQHLTLYLDWTDIAGNEGYTYQLDTVSDFSSPNMLEGTTGTNNSYVSVSNLFFGKTYYWRVMTLSSSGNSDWSTSWNFITHHTVYITNPSNGATDQNISLYIDWTDITGNSGYMYQIDTSQNFNSSLFQEGTTAFNNSHIGVSDLLFGTTYYWRACAKSAVDTSVWSDTWHFTTYYTVTNTSPSNGVINQDTSLYLNWSDITGNAGYMYQIDSSQNFNSSLLQEGATTQNNSYVGISDLLYGTTYYWRTCAKSAVDTSIWSDAWYFTTSYQMTESPNLISPTNGSTGISYTSVDLEWSSIPEATSYQYQYSQDDSFNTGVFNGTIAFLTETIGNLDQNTTYYWRVKGQNSSGYSPWSEIWNFTTETESLDTPVLVSPANNAINQETDITLVWNTVADATNYKCEYSTDNTFVSSTSVFTASTETSLTELDNNTQYFWRVQATDGSQFSEWSEVWNFTTEPETSVNLITDRNIEIFPNPGNDRLYINSDINIKRVSVYNIIGTKIFEENIIKDNYILNTYNYPEGVYIINLKFNDSVVISNKFLVKH